MATSPTTADESPLPAHLINFPRHVGASDRCPICGGSAGWGLVVSGPCIFCIAEYELAPSAFL